MTVETRLTALEALSKSHGHDLLAPFAVPRPLAVTAGNALNLNVIAVTGPTTTSAKVGALWLPYAVPAAKLTYRHNSGGSANASLRFALYNLKADRIVFNVTDTFDASVAAANRTVTLNPAVTLPAGIYHMLACLASGTTAPALFMWETFSATMFAAPSAAEWDGEGTHTITGGNAPASFDPRALTTPGEDATLACRLDGVLP